MADRTVFRPKIIEANIYVNPHFRKAMTALGRTIAQSNKHGNLLSGAPSAVSIRV